MFCEETNAAFLLLFSSFRDFYLQMRVREQAFTTIRNVFKRHGAVEIDTPVFELKEVCLMLLYSSCLQPFISNGWVGASVFSSAMHVALLCCEHHAC